ncbi:hypothetical protein ACUY1T_11490 [Billgrantia sp. Q4P2]|uniref:hypothetical protein n=1 Tax=Billgrantia sp. Q4P2 TaxID=3463857 RepID=UPI0040564260
MPNSREMAIIIWCVVIIIFMLSKVELRSSLRALVKAFFHKHLLVVWIFLLAYFTLGVFLASFIGIWELALTTTAVFWAFGSFVQLFNILNNMNNPPSFSSILRWQVLIFFTVSFLIDFYTMPLYIEIFLVPFAALVAMVNVYVEKKDEYKSVEVITESVLIFIGLGIVVYALMGLVKDYETLFSYLALRQYIIVPYFAAMFIPAVYILYTYLRYDSIFPVYRIYLQRDFGIRLKWLTFLKIGFDFELLNRWEKEARKVFTMRSINSEEDVLKELELFLKEKK